MVKEDKKKNNDIQNITTRTKDWTARTPQLTRGELVCFRRESSSCTISGTRRVTLVTNSMINNEWWKKGITIMTIRA
jgi:hypothetical protein